MRRSTQIIRGALGETSYSKLRDQVFQIRAAFSSKEDPYNIIKRNYVLKDIHKGKRCFVLGNGPSLKKIELPKLRNEYVFTCNYFNLINGFRDVNTNYHIWMDLNCFGLRKDVSPNMEMMSKNFDDIAEGHPLCFAPATAYSSIKHMNLDQKLNFMYIVSDKLMTDYEIIDIDLTKGIYSSSTVVQYAIQIAIFMGFKEIILLGCDSTNILTHLNTILGKHNTSLHAYELEKDNAEDATKELMKTWNTNRFLYDHYNLFVGFEKLNTYCEKNNIRLINCSEPTLITEIEHANIEDILP